MVVVVGVVVVSVVVVVVVVVVVGGVWVPSSVDDTGESTTTISTRLSPASVLS